MIRRIVTTSLWFVSGWAAGSAVAYVADAPTVLGPLVGLAAATVVWWDPAQLLWVRRPDRKRIARRIGDLERVGPGGVVPAGERHLHRAAD